MNRRARRNFQRKLRIAIREVAYISPWTFVAIPHGMLMSLCRFVCAKTLTRGGGVGGGGNSNGGRSTISQIEMVPGAPFFLGV